MPSIQEKIDKWFIDPSKTGWAVPQSRHTWARTGEDSAASNLRQYAHATVTPIYEGNEYMKKWAEGLDSLKNATDPSQARIYHSAWSIDNVETLGKSQGGKASALIKDAASSGVGVYALVSGHLWDLSRRKDFIYDLGIETCALDYRYPSFGSLHQKFTIFKRPTGEDSAIVGSCDIDFSRWGQRPHSPTNPLRPGAPTHEVGVELTGDILSDLEWEFVQRYRDQTRATAYPSGAQTSGNLKGPKGVPPDDIGEPPVRNEQKGKQLVQVLLTYGRGNGYSWRYSTEFTVWASYVNAIKQAQKYLYIEDQVFGHLGFYWWPWYEDKELRHASLVYRLEEAIKRGVNVIVVVPRTAVYEVLKYKREQVIQHLRTVAGSAAGDFHVAFLRNGGSDVYVHSKLMLCDDEFALLGSANFTERSMTTDGELQLGILDTNDAFTRAMRRNLWTEHLAGAVQLPQNAALPAEIAAFTQGIEENKGHLRAYPQTTPPSWVVSFASPSIFWFEGIISPYHGHDTREFRKRAGMGGQ